MPTPITNTGGTAASSLPAAGGSSTSTLSEWAGPYVTNMLGQAQALAAQPYQTYQGPMTAGQSALQTQGFQGLSTLATPSQFTTATSLAEKVGDSARDLAPYQAGSFSTGYSPGQFSTGLGAIGTVESYMNPYMQNVIDIQAREARRQADITQQGQQAKLTRAGAYGGSRDAIMRAELARNLGQQIGDIQEKGLQSAYDRALAQRFQEAGLGLQAQQAAEQARQFGATSGLQAQQAGEQSRQFGVNYGLQGLAQQLAAANQLGALGAQQFGTELQGLNALLAGGAQQRGIEQEGITADYNEFLAQRDYPQRQVQFLQSMLQGLPISTVTNTPAQQSGLGQLTSAVGGLGSLLEAIRGLGLGQP